MFGPGRLVVAALLAAAAPAAPAAAALDWLVLLVDASGSIDAREYELQREAYVGVLRDPEIIALLQGARANSTIVTRAPCRSAVISGSRSRPT